MEGFAKKCEERYCELANQRQSSCTKVSTLCLDDDHFKEEELESVGELSKVCSTDCFDILVLHELADLTFFGQ